MTETDEAANELVADDWATLQRLLYRDSWDEELGRHRSPYVFRGMTDIEYTLQTSLQRFVGESGKWDLEVHLLRNFRQYARQEIDQPESPFHLMARPTPRAPDATPRLDLLASGRRLLRDRRFT